MTSSWKGKMYWHMLADKTENSNEKLITELRGSAWATYDPRKRTRIVELAFQYWRARGFPYYEISLKHLQQEHSRLLAKDWREVFDGRDLRSSNSGLRLANSFQPSMWSAKVNRYRSPMEVFNDDGLLRSAIQRSLTIWPDRFGANASCLRRMLKSYPGAASVSNYRPMIARAIVSKYSPEPGHVVDFASGYGGRLLGTMAAGRSYLGIEPNREQVSGFHKMVLALKSAGFSLPRVKILNGRAEHKLLKVPSASADLVFSSPLFFNWEHYSSDQTQSFRRYPEYDLWKTSFLEPAVAQSFRILRRGGHLALNVTNGNRLPSSGDVKDVALRLGFRLRSISKMLFPKLPYLHPRDGNATKSELLLVFRKS
jgi:SAM-dependent methyltransferase